jgi:hypothetical protein
VRVPLFIELPRKGLLGTPEGLKGIKGGLGFLPRSLDLFGGQPNLHYLLTVFHSLMLWKIEVPQNVQHPLVLALHERVKETNPVTSRYFDQPMCQARPYLLVLPPILDDGCVLGSLVARFAGVAYDGDDLVLGIRGFRATKPKWSAPSVLAKYRACSSDNSFINPKKRR